MNGKSIGNLILMTLICVVTLWVFMALRPAQAGPECVGDKGRCHGYMPAGFIGAHPSNRGPHSCTWSAESRCVALRAYPSRSNSTPQTNGNTRGCVGNCPAKCQASWQRLGFRSVEACYVKWGKLNRLGIARQCEAANRARQPGEPGLPGC
jgi:hypothetical protein